MFVMSNCVVYLSILLGLGTLPMWCWKPIWPSQEHRRLTWQEFVDMVKSRPIAEKYEFVRDNYLRGYELAIKAPEEIQHLDPENEQALEIFQLIIGQETRDTEEDIKRLLTMSTICFPLPIGCIDSDDAGLRPI